MTPGFPHADLVLPIVPAGDGFSYNQLSVSSNASWLVPQVDLAKRNVVLKFNTSGLPEVSRTAVVSAFHGSTSVTVTVFSQPSELMVHELLDDPSRSRMYGLHFNTAEHFGSVLVLDPITGSAICSITVGQRPTSIAVSNDGSELFVLNAGDKTISVIDLVTFNVRQNLALPVFATSVSSTIPDLAVGAGSLLYYTDVASHPVLHVYDRATQQVLQSFPLELNKFGVGDFALNAGKTSLIAWAYKVGSSESYTARMDVGASGTLTLNEKSPVKSDVTTAMLKAPVLWANDNQSVFVKKARVPAGAVTVGDRAFPSEVYAISPGGEIAVTDSAIYQVSTGVKVRDLPVKTSVHAISSDYARLVYFDPVDRRFDKLDLFDLLGNEVLGRVLSPAHGAVVPPPSALAWSGLAGASGYHTYFGTSAADVAAATPASALYLGASSVPTATAPAGLLPGTRYFWRVDADVGGNLNKGEVYTFTVSPLTTPLTKVEAYSVEGHLDQRFTVPLASAGGGLSWSATADQPWVTLVNSSGTTPGELVVRLNAGALGAGVHTAVITFSGGAGTFFMLPVHFTVAALKVTHLKSDPLSSLAYAISEDTAKHNAPAYLLEMDTATENVLRVVPVGMSVTSLALSNAEGRIYVTNSATGSLLALDKSTLALTRTFALPASSMPGKIRDAPRVAAGKAGRLVVRARDNQMDLYDTVEGISKNVTYYQYGSGEFEPTGRYYYCGEADGRLLKLDVTGDIFTVARTSTGPIGSLLSEVVVSENGQAVFWYGRFLNADLVGQWNSMKLIYSASGDGRLAFGEKTIYDTITQQEVLAMPVASRLSAYNTTTRKLVVPNGRRLRCYAVEIPLALPAPVLSAGSSADITPTALPVTWTDTSLETGFGLEYREVGDTDWIQLSPAPVANQTAATLAGLIPDTAYEVRLQAISPTVTSPWSNILVIRTASAPAVTIQFDRVVPAGLALRLHFTTAYGPTSLRVERAPAAGGPWAALATLPGSAVTFDDGNILADVPYFYRLTATRGKIVFAPSEVKGAVLASPGLVVSDMEEVRGEVKLLARTSNSAFPTVIQRRLGTSGTWEDLTTFTTSFLFYTDPSVLRGTTYHYRLKAVLANQTAALSAEVSITTQPAARPARPAGFGPVQITPTQIGLAWEDVVLETGYRIERRPGASLVWTLLATLPANTTAYTDATPVEGEAYVYRLTAFNLEGDSPAVVTTQATAKNLPVLMEDDFDPGVDAAQWTVIVGYGIKMTSGPNTTGIWRFLEVGGRGRDAQTRPVDVSGGGLIEFTMMAGRNNAYGVFTWDDSELGEEVVLEYSRDGTVWTVIQTMDTVGRAFSEWRNLVVPVPVQAWGPATRFRWRQKAYQTPGDDWALDNVRIRSWVEDAPAIASAPASTLVVAGSPATLSVAVDKPAATFQWFKDSVALPGATLASYAVAAARVGDAGSYHCEIRHAGFVVETEPATLGVVENAAPSLLASVPLGGTLQLGVRVHPAAGEGEVTFFWTRSPQAGLGGVGVVSGADSASLTISGATAEAQAFYYCRVSYSTVGTVYVGPFQVWVRQAPVILPLADVDLVAGNPADIGIATTQADATVTVTGLPKGLVYDAATRRILGSSAVVQSYFITVNAANGYGAAPPVSFMLNVRVFPKTLAGTYQGVLSETDPELLHGGQISCALAAKGTVSGSVMIRGKSYRFATAVVAAPNGSWARFQAPFKDSAKNEYIVAGEITGGSLLHRAYVGRRGDEDLQVLAEGSLIRNEWTASSPAPGAGLINAALLPDPSAPAPVPAAPQGTGFLSLTLTPRGVVTCKGRLADGQAVTGSTLMGPGGHIPVFVNLYRGTGSFATLVSYQALQASGTARWGKDDQGAASKDRSFKGGFGRHLLKVEGGRYLRLAADLPLLPALGGAPVPASLRLTGGRLERPVTQDLVFNGKQQAVLPRLPELNPQAVTLSLNAVTGLFTGTFKLADAHPAKPTQTLRRSVSFYGCLIPGSEQGRGSFVLPELPSAEVPGSNLANTPIWSGWVELAPVSTR